MTTKSKTSNTITWNTNQVETFEFITGSWNVLEAKKLLAAKRKKIEEMDISGVEGLVGEPGKIVIGVTIDWSKIQSRPSDFDLSLPIIMVTRKQGDMLPIDGWHRIARAKLEGIKTLPCVLLSRTETKKIENWAR